MSVNNLERRIIKAQLPSFLDYILMNADDFICDEGVSSEKDYGNVQEYSIAHGITTDTGNIKFRFFVTMESK